MAKEKPKDANRDVIRFQNYHLRSRDYPARWNGHRGDCPILSSQLQSVPQIRGAVGREEEHYGYSQEESRPRFENEHKFTTHLNPRGAEFEGIRLATRIQGWYRDRVPDEELNELPAQKGILRISDTDQAEQTTVPV